MVCFDVKLYFSLLLAFVLVGLDTHESFAQQQTANFYRWGLESLDSIDKAYSVSDGKFLYRENYPNDLEYTADYLGGGTNADRPNPYAYLWPFSGTLSAHVALFEASNSAQIKQKIDTYVLPGLANYFDKREPVGYASYINDAPLSDRFYDDNIWLGIDLADLYLLTKEEKYLIQAIDIWKFVLSGKDEKLGGGIYWCEQRKESKNTCSNAPASVLALKLFEATSDSVYFVLGKELYSWTKEVLMDPEDGLYWDNINLSGKLERTKHAYNTGQMIQAAALLYKLTKENTYLQDAKRSAASGYDYFFHKNEKKPDVRVLKNSNVWFIAVMLRGYLELYNADHDRRYVDAFQSNLLYAWHSLRASNGLFAKDWSAKEPSPKKWLLDQFAMVEMYGRLSGVK